MDFENEKWELALSCGKLKHYKDDIYYNVDKQSTKRYWKDGKLHRDDGPAVEHISGYKAWFKEGKRHRLDGPAIEWEDGVKNWYIEGEIYTEEKFNQKIKMMEFKKDPRWKYALGFGELKHYKDNIYYNVDKNGDKRYWKDGKMHREDGPAKEWLNGEKEWWKDGKRHRLDGPAVEGPSGYKAWYIEGIKYTEEEYKEKVKIMELEKDPKWKKSLNYGELKHYKDDIYYNVDKLGYKRYWKDGNLHRDDGPAIEWKDRFKQWFKEGQLHRLDGPAFEYSSVHKEWFIEGKEYTEEQFKHKIKIMEFKKDPKWKRALSFGELKHYKDNVYCNVDEFEDKRYWKDGLIHRDDGPAIELSDGQKEWWKNGLLHRLDGPAIEDIKGYKAWFKEGERHRLDGPAREWGDGTKWWYKENKFHRLDGPAIEYSNGYKEWYIEGWAYTEEKFKQNIKIMEMEKDPIWKQVLTYGKLKHYKDDIYYNVDKLGHKRYWKDGKCHRLDGPAIEFSDGSNSWFVNGEGFTEKSFNMKFSENTKQDINTEQPEQKSDINFLLGIAGAVFLGKLKLNNLNNKNIEEKLIMLEKKNDRQNS